MLRGWVLAGLAVVVGFGAPGDIYQWTYDQLVLGPGWRGHVFANRTGEEAVGLELLVAEGGPAQVLVAGGQLQLSSVEGKTLSYLGKVAPGGLVIVALPHGTSLEGARWITRGGPVPVSVEDPLIRAQAAEGWVMYKDPKGIAWLGKWMTEQGAGGGILWWEWETYRQVQRTMYELAWIWQIDVEALRRWDGFPILVLVDGRRSFSPVGAELVAWEWRWDDGLVQDGPVVVRGFEAPGQYSVTVRAVDGLGRVQVLRRPLTVGLPEFEEPKPHRPPEEGVGGGSKTFE